VPACHPSIATALKRCAFDASLNRQSSVNLVKVHPTCEW